jgi:hypothetical protein
MLEGMHRRIGDGDLVKYTPEDNFIIVEARANRNNLLAQSDKMVLPDRLSESKITEWKTYRKALRDMDFSDPDNITWPTKPEAS